MPAREVYYEDVIQPRLDTALVVPERPRRTDREIRAEIKALEEERRLLRADRSPSPLPAADEVVVKRDYKGISFILSPFLRSRQYDTNFLHRSKPSIAPCHDGKLDLNSQGTHKLLDRL